MKRYNLRTWDLSGEAGSVDHAAIYADIEKVRKKTEEYKIENIFNMDETGLFFRLMPNRSYILPSESRKTVRGTTKDESQGPRYSVRVRTNANGTVKFHYALLVSRSIHECSVNVTNANRRKDIVSKCALPYLIQKKAWSDTKNRFFEWWEHVFLPFIYSWTGDPALLILDNCGPHGA